MKILLTGFEPFGRLRSNPSEQIVRRIAARPHSSKDDLVAEILPTEFSAAEKKIRRLIGRHRPAAVLCVGVAASRETICLERIALNLDDDPFPDNAGAVRQGRAIAPGGPLAYASTLPLAKMRKVLERDGIPAKISNHAGTYVCNHVFYAARHEVERLGSSAPCGLIHVPAVRKRTKNSKQHGSKKPGTTLSVLVAAVERCIEVLKDQKP
jgi:pyroglutamyl-peptidase